MDTAIQAADTLLLTVPNQLVAEYNAHAIESILRYVAPELGWRQPFDNHRRDLHESKASRSEPARS